jgi:HTH-type transcriptional regulator / antitoxin HipB
LIPRYRVFQTGTRIFYRDRGNYDRIFLFRLLCAGLNIIYYRDRGNMNIVEIAEAVKHHRKVAGLSQAALGRLAGVGKTAVFDLEHRKETIRFDVVRKILETLNISVKLVSPIHRSAGEPGNQGNRVK